MKGKELKKEEARVNVTQGKLSFLSRLVPATAESQPMTIEGKVPTVEGKVPSVEGKVPSIEGKVASSYYVGLENDLSPSWKSILNEEFKLPYWSRLIAKLNEEYATGKEIYPAKEDIFRAFLLCRPDQVKVVIIGQDPYVLPNQAHGLCFSVPDGIKIPPSLENVFRAIRADIGVIPSRMDSIDGNKPAISISGNLTKWATRGVLMMNTSLTVNAKETNSHGTFGWSHFTDAIVKYLNEKCSGIVFLLWGSVAQAKCSMVDEKKHLVLKASHPSTRSDGTFISCRHFSRTNEYLKSINKEPIDWSLY